MEILLVRHAIAEERSPKVEEGDRKLTRKGITKFEKEVPGLERLGLTIDRIMSSPWKRAVQTAELLAPVATGKVHKTDLLCDDPGDELLKLLADQPQSQRIALVGHEPWMSDLLALLCFGSPRHGEQILFKKGGVAWLEGEPIRAGMNLLALYPPRTLRKLR